ncbi:uncharacterized protein LOC111366405 [Olea europaea var. sylvestris]|uniref:uncharacterized protein LOC111366405 n=1 Tax=Olea europaea var. sylvestris TaxID=158386 RepID=UPI000C1D6823|nr:uncharacterized protein LOC111366405 [Olea europaea var. sylvestris]
MGHVCDTEVTVVSITDAREVEEGRVFRDKDVLKMSLSFFAIQNMFEFMVGWSDKREYIVRCSNVLGSHRQVSSKVVSSTIKYKYTLSRTIYTPKDICSDMLNTFRVYLSYMKAWRSRKQTLKMIRGDPTKSFGKLPKFFYMLRQKNPGTITEIEVGSHSKFKYCFMTLGASIRGWEHCRPVIVVGGTYLNGKYGGTLFIAYTQDTNNSIFVLTFGIGDNENNKSWGWFFDELKKACGNREGLCFVSDRHPSIKNVIEHVYSRAYHGICSYHLLQNIKSYYRKLDQNITQAFNSTIRAYTLEEYDYNLSLLTTMNENIISYMARVGPEKWSQIHIPTNKYSTMTSNIVESVNTVTKAVKNYPILSVNGTNLCNPISKSVTYVSPSNQIIFSISNKRSMFVVDIEQQTCTCRILQVDLLLCPHALAIIVNTRRDPYDYCFYYYTKNARVPRFCISRWKSRGMDSAEKSTTRNSVTS